ncbi:unnamed protein product, partial [Allacma fusca]
TVNSVELTIEQPKTPEVILYVQNEIITEGTKRSECGPEIPLVIYSAVQKRQRKRKLFYDEESKLTDVKKVLRTVDNSLKVAYGEQIIQLGVSLKPLTSYLRKHLVKCVCEDLTTKCNSNEPSTDQRNQLAECIVSQLYPTLVGKERTDLKNAYFSHSKMISLLKFKTRMKWKNRGVGCRTTTPHLLLDTNGAIQQDFQMSYPLVSDSLSSKWSQAAEKIVQFFSSKKKSLLTFGIADGGHSNDIVAFFMLSALFRPKIKKITSLDGAKAFIEVINPLVDLDDFATTTSDAASAKI